MKRLAWIGAGLAAVAAFGGWDRAQADRDAALRVPYDDAEAVALGETIYAETCAACHGADLEGQANWRQRNADGRLPAPPQDETGHTWHHTDAANFAMVKFGAAALIGNGYESDMPGFEGVLSDDEILAVLAYIKSRWPADIVEMHDAMNARQ